MRLLFDANISPELIERLSDVFPDSAHVALEDLRRAADEAIWGYAAEHGYAIVSKDEDFHQMALLRGPPPKVVWVRLGNCSTDDIEREIRAGRDAIETFERDDEASFLVLGNVR